MLCGTQTASGSTAARVTSLRGRESATADMIHQIDGKIARLSAARRARAEALARIRCELAGAHMARPAAPDDHEQRP